MYVMCQQVAVIQSSVKESELNLTPPGPDYLMISVKYDSENYER